MPDDKSIEELDVLTTLASGDLLAVVDDPSGTPVTMGSSIDNILKAVNILTANTTPAAADELLLVNDPEGTPEAQKATVLNLLKAILTTNGDILFRNNSGVITRLAKGSANHLLKMNDAATEPEWEAAAGGGQARKSLPIAGCYLPDDSANNAAAQIQHKTSSGGTLHPAWKEAAFDASADEHIMYCFLMPDNYASAPLVDVYYKCASATANDVCFAAALMAVTDGDAQDVDADAFDTANTQTDTVPGTAGHMGVCSITMTNADSVAANDLVVLVVFRDVSGDGVSGDVEVPLCVLRYTST